MSRSISLVRLDYFWSSSGGESIKFVLLESEDILNIFLPTFLVLLNVELDKLKSPWVSSSASWILSPSMFFCGCISWIISPRTTLLRSIFSEDNFERLSSSRIPLLDMLDFFWRNLILCKDFFGVYEGSTGLARGCLWARFELFGK